MNELLSFPAGQKVAKAFAHLDPSRSLGDGIIGGFSSINYRGKVWSLRHQGANYHFLREDDGTPLSYLDVIIVGMSPYISKVYYPPGEWSEDAAGPPVCSAVKGDVPDAGVPEPQARSCAVCKNNAWTTLPNGGRGKFCQDHRRLAILLMPAVTAKMLGSPLTEPVFLKVPPGSLTSLKNYGDALTHQGIPFEAVVTRISFSPDKLFRMIFRGQQMLSDKEAPVVLPLLDDPRTKRLIGDQPIIQEIRDDGPPPTETVETGLLGAFGGGLTEVPPPNPLPKVRTLQRLPSSEPAQPKPKLAPHIAIDPEADRGPGPRPDQEAAPKRRPGRPAKAATAAPTADVTPAAQPEQPTENTQNPMWGEASNEIEQEIAELLGKKVADML